MQPEQAEAKTPSNYNVTDKTDGRKLYEWESKYPLRARVEMGIEGIFLFAILMVSLCLIYFIWRGSLSQYLQIQPARMASFNKYSYYATSGLLGGVVFGIKYFYRSVARGWWHQDRRAWRLMSPFLALTTALMVGSMVDASFISTAEPSSGPAFAAIGFLTGYFADKAIAKMGEVADVIFGKSGASKD